MKQREVEKDKQNSRVEESKHVLQPGNHLIITCRNLNVSNFFTPIHFIILHLFLPLQVSSWFINEQDFSSHGAGSGRLLSSSLWAKGLDHESGQSAKPHLSPVDGRRGVEPSLGLKSTWQENSGTKTIKHGKKPGKRKYVCTKEKD